MAQFVRTIVELVDDIDGSQGDETIEFSWDGKDLVIDLSTANARTFRQVVEPFVGAARPKPKPKKQKAKEVTPQMITKGAEAEAKALRNRIRQWGRDNGYEVSNVSKIPQPVLDAYRAAMGGE
jgi:hypothetical protein